MPDRDHAPDHEDAEQIAIAWGWCGGCVRRGRRVPPHGNNEILTKMCYEE